MLVAILNHSLERGTFFRIFTTDMRIKVLLNNLDVVINSVLSAFTDLSFQGLICLIPSIGVSRIDDTYEGNTIHCIGLDKSRFFSELNMLNRLLLSSCGHGISPPLTPLEGFERNSHPVPWQQH